MKLYVPDHFLNKSKEIELVRKYPFATLISNSGGSLEISKIPLLLKTDGDDLVFEGHFSKANPHWKTISNDPKLTLIFDGAHDYVSPTWYSDPVKNVPTWNYSSVIAEVEGEVIQDKEWIAKSLGDLANNFENNRVWIDSVDKEFFGNLTNGVVGLRAKVTSIKSKFKLSQNREGKDQIQVIEKFKEINKDLADDMNNWGQL